MLEEQAVIPDHVQFILQTTDATPIGNYEWWGNCPCHTPSDNQELKIGWDGDQVFLLCYQSCSMNKIVESLDVANALGVPVISQPVDSRRTVQANQSGNEVPAAHKIYSMLVKSLPLHLRHRKQLRAWGLPDHEIDLREYRSLTVEKAEKLGSIPPGILVPVRDEHGLFIAAKILKDRQNSSGRKYNRRSSELYLVRAEDRKQWPEDPPIHRALLPGGRPFVEQNYSSDEIYVVQTEVLADIASAKTNQPAIGNCF